MTNPAPVPGEPQPGPYGQQPHWYGPPPDTLGGPGSPPPPPPFRSRKVLLVGAAVGVLLLATVGITGFAAPGFFLSGSDGDPAAVIPPPATPPSASPEDVDAQALAEEFLQAWKDKDEQRVADFVCAGRPKVESFLEAVAKNQGIGLVKVDDLRSDKLLFFYDLVQPSYYIYPMQVTFVADGDEWCWHDLSLREPRDTPSNRDVMHPAAQAVVDDFVAALNDTNADAASDRLCSYHESQDRVTDALNRSPDLAISEVPHFSDSTVVVLLDGTLDGEPVTGIELRVWADVENPGAWCVFDLTT